MKLDFRTKALMTIVISFVLLFGNLQKTYPWVAWCLMALPYMLLLSEKKFGKAFKGIAWLIVALILEKCAVYFSFSGLLASVALFFSIIVLRMLPGIVMGEYSHLTTS
ncbi:MAG: energy-coupling factor transporter transmembrane protein EcfT, partial [Streptococcus gallolyticus]|nr:energy-coupling factor transporter transmembrane protein EcfT [Streptococcus gallolyticus]